MCTGSSILSEDRVDDRLSWPRGHRGRHSVDAQIEVAKSTVGNRNRASHERPGRPNVADLYPSKSRPWVIRVVSSRPRYVRLSSETHRESRDGGLAALGPGRCENSDVVLTSRPTWKSKSRKELPGSSQAVRSSRGHDSILSHEPFGKGTITSQVR